MLEKAIEIEIGIAIEIENDYHNTFDPDPDFDPGDIFEKHQNLKLITLI